MEKHGQNLGPIPADGAAPASPADQIVFENGRSALLVEASQGKNPYAIISQLKIRQPKAVIVVAGGAKGLDEQLTLRLRLLFNRGIARAAAQAGAVILDGGTNSGVMALTGAAVADRGDEVALIGVAPAGKSGYRKADGAGGGGQTGVLEPFHSHFVLVEGDTYGSETATLFSLAEALAQPPPKQEVEKRQSLTSRSSNKGAEKAKPAPPRLPVVVVLAGGGVQGVACKEVIQSVRRGWPVIIIEGSGGLADELARLMRSRPENIPDADIAEIIEEGNLTLAGIDQPPAVLRQQIVRQLGGNELLVYAWKRYGMYSTQSKRHQRNFNRLQEWILFMGVITTLFVVIKVGLQMPNWTQGLPWLTHAAKQGLSNLGQRLDPWLYVIVLLLPIITSAMISIATRLNAGNKWVLLRSSAEAVKREIMLYRTRPALLAQEDRLKIAPGETRFTDAASGEQLEAEVLQETPSELLVGADAEATLEIELYRHLEQIDQELMQSPVAQSALPEYEGKIPPGSASRRGDDGLSYLTPQRYIYLRLDEQLDYYRIKTKDMEAEVQRVQTGAILLGGLGTFLAAIRLELWVAVTAALVTALGAYLHYRQTESTLVRYNTTASNLDSVLMWWASLTPNQQAVPENVRRLVDTTEKILESESVGWLAQMRSAIADLSRKTDGESEKAS